MKKKHKLTNSGCINKMTLIKKNKDNNNILLKQLY